jgi:thioredoxin-related protein
MFAAVMKKKTPRVWTRLIIAFAFSALAFVAFAAFAQTNDPEPSSREWERILPVATDLKADGAKALATKKPILLFFNLEGCHFCRFSLRTTVVPMFRDPKFRDAMEFRQITIDDGKSLIDFDGKRVKNEDFAKQRKGTFTPTIMMVDGNGKQIGESIVGIANADFYSGYVEALAETSIESLKKKQ